MNVHILILPEARQHSDGVLDSLHRLLDNPHKYRHSLHLHNLHSSVQQRSPRTIPLTLLVHRRLLANLLQTVPSTLIALLYGVKLHQLRLGWRRMRRHSQQAVPLTVLQWSSLPGRQGF